MFDPVTESADGFEAIILVGGKGTRLGKLTSIQPKPMMEICGRPFLVHLLNILLLRGCRHAVLAIGYLGEQIKQYLGTEYCGMNLTYSHEKHSLGTGGAIKQAMKCCDSESVVVINGDTVFDIDFEHFLNMQRESNTDFMVAVRHVDEATRFGTVVVKDGKLRAFQEKGNTGPGLVAGGMYAIASDALEHMPDVFSIERDYEEVRAANGDISAFIANGYFIDIGIPEDLEIARHDFTVGFRSAAFFDRDGTINIDTGHLSDPELLQFIEGAPEIIKRHNEKGDFVVVVTNQSGIAKGYYKYEQMHELHCVMNERLRTGWDAHIDAFHYCPHYPDIDGYCFCRKPNPGLILEAAKMHNIDLKRSVMYGDKESDRLAAQSAGVTFLATPWVDKDLTIEVKR